MKKITLGEFNPSNNVFTFRPKVKWTNPRLKFRYFKDKVRWSWQRITRGYCDYDTWDIDNWLSVLLSNSLKDFADKTHSYPFGLTYEEWKTRLDEAAENFSHWNSEWDWGNPYDPLTQNKEWRDAEIEHEEFMYAEVKKGFNFLAKNFGDMWD